MPPIPLPLPPPQKKKKLREKSRPRQIFKHFNVFPARKILSNVPYQFLYTFFNWISRANPFFFLLHNAPWLVKKFPTTSSTNKTQSGKELSLDHMRFPALEHCLVTLSSHWLSEKFSFFPFNWLLCWVWFLVSICVCSETSWFVMIHIFDRLLHPLKMPWRAWLWKKKYKVTLVLKLKYR